jgi:uncharacterized protein YjdB
VTKYVLSDDDIQGGVPKIPNEVRLLYNKGEDNMSKKASYSLRTLFTKVMVAVLMIAAIAFIPSYSAQAAKAPTISKKTLNIMVKGTYDLNIKNEIKGANYVWSSNNEKIATVDAAGVVKGKTRGNAVITCKITAGKSVYTVSSKVKVVSGAKSFIINNKITVLNKGQVYNLNRTLTPFTSNDVTTWTSSNTSIAKPDKNGKFTALKAGTVTITGTTLSGMTDSVKIRIIDADGAVATQAEMEELLKLGASKITLRTGVETTFTIPEGNYKNTTLVVDAPKADVYNSGVFKSIELLQIAPNTFHEKARGNKLVIKSSTASIEVAPNASVAIEITSVGAKVTIKNDKGEITGVVMMSAADLKIEGESSKPIPVEIKAKGASITSSVPMAVTASAPAALTLLKGAESTSIAVDKAENIPAIAGDVTIIVTVGTGAAQTKIDVKGEKIEVKDPGAPSAPSSGGTPGGSTGGDPGGPGTPDKGYTVQNINGKLRYTLTKPVTQIKSIDTSFMGFSVDGEMLSILLSFLNDAEASLTKWQAGSKVTKTYRVAGSDFEIEASAANGNTRTIKLVKTPIGLLDGREYTVTLDIIDVNAKTGAFTIRGGATYLTVAKIADNILEIQTDIENLTFEPKF